MEKLIVDGKEAILGRLGSFVAKELLKGKAVIVINCEEIIVSGRKENFVGKIMRKRRMGRGSSLKGPRYVRQADRLVKRIIRGMLPWDRMKGRDAYGNLKCYIGNGDLDEKALAKVKTFKHLKPMRYSYMKEIEVALK